MKMRIMLVLGLLLGLFGCEDEGTCAALGHVINVGDKVVDHEAGVSCLCTAEGPVCVPIEAEKDAGNALADYSFEFDAAQGGHGGQAGPDEGAGGGGGATDQRVDPRPRDAGIDAAMACPDTPPQGACVGGAGLRCRFGAEPFNCCQREYTAEVTCLCGDDERWTCVDHRANCGGTPEGYDCLRTVGVCEAWHRIRERANEDRAYQNNWDGDVEACDPGQMPPRWHELALAEINDWRYLAELPPVTTSPDLDVKSQACALALQARGAITHNLRPEDPCYSAEAQEGAARGLVWVGGGPVRGVGVYVEDLGDFNFAGLPHRLWLFSHSLGPVGIGGTSNATCTYVVGGHGQVDRRFTTWPAAGTFPYDAPRAGVTGWSIQGDFRMIGSQITVTRLNDGEQMPVISRDLQTGGRGADNGLAFVPDGWSPQPGEDYRVLVEGAAVPIDYEVNFVDCGQ